MAHHLEIACFNAESAIVAAEAGADRIELCKEQEVGGTTPSLSTFLTTKSAISSSSSSSSSSPSAIPIHVMIRLRGGSFTYTALETQQMQASIRALHDAGANGFVFGCLTPTHLVDAEACALLLAAAGGRPCVFHRAFDEVPRAEMGAQLRVLRELGFEAVLTSGGAVDAGVGREVLGWLRAEAQGRIEVIVGGGVRVGNLRELVRTGARWFHSSAIVDSGEVASADEVRAMRVLLDSL